MILNITLRQAERLALMKAPITINDGKASISLLAFPVALLAIFRHNYIVSELRDQWNERRQFDRIIEKNRAILKRLDALPEDQSVYEFAETYMITRYQTLHHLGKRWFTRTP